MPLKLITPPACEPISVQDFKSHARISRDDEDATIKAYIAASRLYAETRQRRQLISATWQLSLDSFYPCESDLPLSNGMPLAQLVPLIEARFGYGGALAIQIPRPPLQSITSIQYVDTDGATQTLDPTLYIVDTVSEPGRIAPAFNQIWPITRAQINAVTITFVAGYGATAGSVPATTRHAVRMLASHYYEHREAVSDGPPMSPAPLAVDSLLGAEDFGGYK